MVKTTLGMQLALTVGTQSRPKTEGAAVQLSVVLHLSGPYTEVAGAALLNSSEPAAGTAAVAVGIPTPV